MAQPGVAARVATGTPPTGAARRRVAVTPNDGVWLQDSPTNLMVINAVFSTDAIALGTVRDAFRTRVLEADPERYARFRQRIVHEGGRAYWEHDPNFDLGRQIVPASVDHLATEEQLREYVGLEASKPLPADRPPWQIQVIEDFGADASAFVVRIHHAIGDGIALVSVIFALMDLAGEPAGGPARSAAPPAPGGRLLRLLRIPLAAPMVLLSRTLWPRDRHPLHGPKLSGRKRVAWTAPLDLTVVKQVKDRLGATVNDVLMACVSGAFSRYLAAQAHAGVTQFRVSMPVSVRPVGAPPTLENRFAAVPLVLPAGAAEVPARVAAVKRRMDALKRSVEPIVVYGIVKVLLTTLPHWMSRGLIDFLANKCTAVVTNVPGPPQPIMLAGRRVRSLVFWVPQRADIGLGVSILSFAGSVQIGVLCDTSVVPDPLELIHAFEAEFESLRRL